jgi:hypothetical protein
VTVCPHFSEGITTKHRSYGLQLACVPLALGSVSSPTISSAGSTSLTIRAIGFQPGIKLAIGWQACNGNICGYEYTDCGFAGIALRPPAAEATNANGDTVSLDAAVFAN